MTINTIHELHKFATKMNFDPLIPNCNLHMMQINQLLVNYIQQTFQLPQLLFNGELMDTPIYYNELAA